MPEKEKKCENCKWWENIPDNDEEGQLREGTCRVHAPVIGNFKWPETDELDWCGEFKER